MRELKHSPQSWSHGVRVKLERQPLSDLQSKGCFPKTNMLTMPRSLLLCDISPLGTSWQQDPKLLPRLTPQWACGMGGPTLQRLSLQSWVPLWSTLPDLSLVASGSFQPVSSNRWPFPSACLDNQHSGCWRAGNAWLQAHL